MSMPETEMRDSWEAWRRIAGRMAVMGETRSSGSKSPVDVMSEGSAVRSEDSSLSRSSGMAAWGSVCWRYGDNVKLASEKEFAGLTADITAVAGLLLVVRAIGVLELRIVERLGGMRPRDLRRRCLLPLLATSSVPDDRRIIGGIASGSEL